MGHFRSDLRDVEFDLFEVFRVQEGPAAPDVDTDPDTLRDLLRELDRLATGPLAEGYADADRHPPVFDPATHTVTLPEPVKRAYRLLWDGEWWRLGLPPELGGLGVPSTVQWAAAELILGANPGGVPLPRRPALRLDRAPPRHAGAAALGRADDRTRLGRDDGAHRAGRRVGRRRGPDPGRRAARRHLAPRRREAVHHLGRARPRPRTSCTSCWPGRRARASPRSPARRACRCSSCRSSTSTRSPASPASATACSSRTSSARWASRRP